MRESRFSMVFTFKSTSPSCPASSLASTWRPVEGLPLHRPDVLRPLIFNMDQRPLAATEAKMLNPGDQEVIILGIHIFNLLSNKDTLLGVQIIQDPSHDAEKVVIAQIPIVDPFHQLRKAKLFPPCFPN